MRTNPESGRSAAARRRSGMLGRSGWVALLAAAVLPALTLRASGAVKLVSGVIGAGGGVLVGGEGRMVTTLGLPVSGRSRGQAGQLMSGFWWGDGRPPTTASATPPTNPTPSPPAATASPTATTAGPRRWTINSSDDVDDGHCDGAHCSLREALTAANDAPGADRIEFAIPGSDAGCVPGGPCTLKLTAELPGIFDDDTTIDGSSQPGSRPNTAPVGRGLDGAVAIVLDGARLPWCCPSGLTVYGDRTLIRGLAIHGFYSGIRMLDGAASRIEGVYVGTDARGLAAPGNRCNGITVESQDEGGRDHLIGGAAPAARNLVSGNTCAGIEIGGASGVQVLGNIIGADAGGERALANGYSGLRFFSGASRNRAGGEASGEANLIAFNGLAGVEVTGAFGSTRGNRILGNSIHDNGLQGISLSAGGNDSLAAPVLVAADMTWAEGTACARCLVELFSDAADEGSRFEGRVLADDRGSWRIVAVSAFVGPNLTATATDGDGNTSAFALPLSLRASDATPSPTARTTAAAATATPTVTPPATEPAWRARIWLPALSRQALLTR